MGQYDEARQLVTVADSVSVSRGRLCTGRALLWLMGKPRNPGRASAPLSLDHCRGRALDPASTSAPASKPLPPQTAMQERITIDGFLDALRAWLAAGCVRLVGANLLWPIADAWVIHVEVSRGFTLRDRL